MLVDPQGYLATIRTLKQAKRKQVDVLDNSSNIVHGTEIRSNEKYAVGRVFAA
jgi:hypothetical protein